MSAAEWESLCDGCGRCCLHKLEDADDGRVYYTKMACELLDIAECRCQDYSHRTHRVPACAQLSVAKIAEFHWLPETCGYRRLAAGQGLPHWHPLITGDPNSAAKAGISIENIAIPHDDNADLQQHIISLPLAAT